MVALARLIASGFGTGATPVAPGTVASAAALGLGTALLAWHPVLLWVAALLASYGGWAAVSQARIEGDPGWVVADEIAGQLIAMLPLARFEWPRSLPGLIAAFAIFRLFDIMKPGPIGWAERMPGALGVMGDDLIAGLLTAMLLMLARLAGAPW